MIADESGGDRTLAYGMGDHQQPSPGSGVLPRVEIGGGQPSRQSLGAFVILGVATPNVALADKDTPYAFTTRQMGPYEATTPEQVADILGYRRDQVGRIRESTGQALLEDDVADQAAGQDGPTDAASDRGADGSLE